MIPGSGSNRSMLSYSNLLASEKHIELLPALFTLSVLPALFYLRGLRPYMFELAIDYSVVE
jgi:hypothetical protein